MEHPMTVRAHERKVTQFCLVAGVQFRDRHRVMALDKAFTERTIGRLKIEPAGLTRERAMLSDGPLFSFPYERAIPFAQLV